jgi:hypothetical protein
LAVLWRNATGLRLGLPPVMFRSLMNPIRFPAALIAGAAPKPPPGPEVTAVFVEDPRSWSTISWLRSGLLPPKLRLDWKAILVPSALLTGATLATAPPPVVLVSWTVAEIIPADERWKISLLRSLLLPVRFRSEANVMRLASSSTVGCRLPTPPVEVVTCVMTAPGYW